MGIVGAGTWGRTHASIYAEHLFADPVAICDMNEARAREIADITIGADDLSVMVTLKEISNGLMNKIHKNYRRIVGINGSLIALGVTGVIQPTMSALLHNTSTLLIGMDSMKSVL